MLSASSYGCSKVFSFLFKIIFDSGKRIYAKNYRIEDRLGYPEVLSASSYGYSKVNGFGLRLSFDRNKEKSTQKSTESKID